jgi:hypothetical protein
MKSSKVVGYKHLIARSPSVTFLHATLILCNTQLTALSPLHGRSLTYCRQRILKSTVVVLELQAYHRRFMVPKRINQVG